MKVCNRCKIEKEDCDYRIRKEKRKGKEFNYLNNTCRNCDSELQRIYYQGKKDNDDFKQKNCRRVNDYRCSNKEKCVKKAKERRQTKTYKDAMRAYRDKNKSKIQSQERVTKNRYHSRHRDNLTDEYIIRLLINQDVATRESLRLHPEIIEAKRIQLLIKRKVNAD